MQIQDQDQDINGGQIQSMPPTQPTHRRPKPQRGWITSIGATIGILLIVGLTLMLFTWRKADQSSQSGKTGHTGYTGHTDAQAQWTLALDGYTVQSLVAAPSNASILYACASKVSSPAPGVVTPLSHPTLLRSIDDGTQWQDIGSQAQIGNQCQVAINPANSNDIYSINKAVSASSPATLRYSNDGGQSWTTITPTLQNSGSTGQAIWGVQQLRMVGNTLFGIQNMPRVLNPPPGQTWASRLYPQPRLVKSTDGGQTWTIADGYFDQNSLGVSSYAVDPQNPQIIYEIVSHPYWIGGVQPATGAGNISGTLLYKTTDGGANWQQLLSGLPFSSKVQLASNNPSIVYAGGTIGPMPLVAGASNTTPRSSTLTPVSGNFNLRVSQNGGATWNRVSTPTHFVSVQDWFVSPNGTLYASSGYSSYSQSGPPIVTRGTATLVGTVTVPQSSNKSGTTQGSTGGNNNQSIANSGSSAQVPTGGSPAPLSTPHTSAQIEQYDLATGQWSSVAQAPAYGTLIAVTPGSQGQTVLWAQVASNNRIALYRYQ